MGFTPDDEPITAGPTLIISDIRSQNYVAGVSGWIIEANGDVEFNDVTVRGEVFVNGSDGSQISIEKVNVSGSLQPTEFFTPGDPAGYGGYRGAQLYGREVIPSDPLRILNLVIEGPRWDFLAANSPSIRLIGSSYPANAIAQHIDMYSAVHIRDMFGSNGDLQVDGTITSGGAVNGGYTYQQTVYFTSSGNFLKASYPAAKRARIRLVGGGGGGGGCAANAAGNNSAAGGGGAGAYAESFLDVSTFAASETVTVGAAGTAGTAGGAGGAGGTTSFGAFVSANGGNGGGGGGTATTFFLVGGGAEQATGTGTVVLPGGPGSWGLRNTGTYVTGQQMGGNGGYSQLGAGGRGSNNANGAAGSNYGGGGGGASAPASTGGFTGGAGGPGLVIVDLFG